MEKLNEYLQVLLSTCSYELHLEPNKNPYIISSNGTTDVTNTPLLGTQISMMVFPLIPANVKQQLPTSSEVEFVHPHNLGDFNFLVKKSPAGFNVTIRPMLSNQPAKTDFNPDEFDSSSFSPNRLASFSNSIAESSFNPLEQTSTIYSEKTSSDFSVSENDISYSPEMIVEENQSVFANEENIFNTPQIETISVNDPEFMTVFSESSTFEPPATTKSELVPVYESDSDLEFGYSSQDDSAIEFSLEPKIIDEAQPVQFFESNISVRENQNLQNLPSNASAPLPQQQFVEPSVQQFQMPHEIETAAFVPAQSNPQEKMRMDALFRKMAEVGASDLHLSVSMPPLVRKDGKMQKLQCNESTLTADTMRELLTSIMPAKNREEFSSRNDTDFAYEIPNLARFRANVFMDRKGMGGVFRIIPSKMTTAEQIGLPPAILDLCDLSKGLVVVTGPTGSGKSTTLCAMINHINLRREEHIITIEDPIEFVHENHKCLVNQREVHNHTDSFKDALRAALREDPDILLVGEMRDLETIAIAIETAETGHLVFGTLHTTTAASTVDRIIDQFPADRQQQIRVMLSESLKGVVAQTLLPKKGGGRVAALEVLIVTPAISNLIREGKTFQIPSAMQTGKQHGMVMLNDALFALVQKGLVEPHDAYIKAADKAGFESLLTRGGFKI